MGDKKDIKAKDFCVINGISFLTEMDDYINLNYEKAEKLKAICQFIADAYNKEKDPHPIPQWTRTLFDGAFNGYRVEIISLEHPLNNYIDPVSKSNFLIFRRKGNTVTIIHFGPFSDKKAENFRDNIGKTKNKLTDLIQKTKTKIKNKENYKSKISAEDETVIRNVVVRKYCALVLEIQKKIDIVEAEISKLVRQWYAHDLNVADDIINDLHESIVLHKFGENFIKLEKTLAAVIGDIAIDIAKTSAKVAASTGKHTGKTVAKKIPLFGLGVGIACAGMRIMQGDGEGALGEVASGLFSIVPGAGTAASIAIDAALIGRDIYDLQENVKRSKVRVLFLQLLQSTISYSSVALGS